MLRTAQLERTYHLPAGDFRGLEWPERDRNGDASGSSTPETAVFLHGLSGMADVWSETVAALGEHRPRCVAIDQRGHGRSPVPHQGYDVGDYLGDLLALVSEIGRPARLVGHSMGARVALVAASRHPEWFSSVTVVDIGPEAWKRNIETTARLLGALPESFPDRDSVLDFAGALVGERGRAAAQRLVEDRMREQPDGSYVWLGSRQGQIETVRVQRGRNYWRDWERISIPALLVRGGDSNELRPRILDEMRRRNQRVDFIEIEGVGHNIPMLAPEQLGEQIRRFWERISV